MPQMPLRHFLGLCLLATGAAQVDAGIITVLNSSFESPAQANAGDFTRTAPDDWTMTGAGGVFRPITGGAEVNTVPDGLQVGWLYSGGSFFQDLGVSVDLSQSYQLDLFVGTQLDNPAPSVSYRVDLVSGGVSGTIIAEAIGTLSATSDFVPISISGTGLGSGNLGVLISATGGQPLFDDIRVQDSQISVTETSAPEPATLVIWSLVAGAFGVVRPGRRLRGGVAPV